jgi:hypothetical protein
VYWVIVQFGQFLNCRNRLNCTLIWIKIGNSFGDNILKIITLTPVDIFFYFFPLFSRHSSTCFLSTCPDFPGAWRPTAIAAPATPWPSSSPTWPSSGTPPPSPPATPSP